MGNAAGGHRRRSSMEEEFVPSGNPSHLNIHIDRRKTTFQTEEEDRSESSVTSILTGGKGIHAIADQLRDSRLYDSSGRPLLYVGGPTGATDVSEPQFPGSVPTVFRWEGGGKDVYISGTFNGWRSKIPMVRSSSKRNFYTIIDLPLGEHQFKFIVDGQWKVDQNQTVITGASGVQNNVIEVKASDFDVLSALSHDMANSRSSGHNPEDSSHSGTPPQAGDYDLPTSHPSPAGCASATSAAGGVGGSTPPGDYGRVIPSSPLAAMTMHSGSSAAAGCAVSHYGSDGSKTKIPSPPLLPPQLLQVILNCDTNVQCDPNLLPQPNHVMVNHMYALSIKDGVIVLSAITRYRQKFVSTVLYKPI